MNVLRSSSKIRVQPGHQKKAEESTSRSYPECTVSGALAVTLMISRVVGLAPLSFRRRKNNLTVRVSPLWCGYSYVLIFILDACIIAGLALDLFLEQSKSVRTRSSSAAFAWIVEVALTLIITTYAIGSVAGRTNNLILCLQVIQKVNWKIHHHLPGNGLEWKWYIIGFSYLLVGWTLYIVDFYLFVHEAITEGRDLNVVCLYISFYIEFMASFPLEMQFVYVVIKIVTSLKAVNNAMEDLLKRLDSQERASVPVLNLEDFDDQWSRLNLFRESSKRNKPASPSSKKDVAQVRLLILSYGAICDVLRQMNESHGVLLVLLLISFFLHLVITPYYLIAFWMSTKVRTASICLNIFHYGFHFSNMMFVIEPGQRAANEMANTQVLLSQLSRRVSTPGDPMAHELDLFFKQITLNPVSFTPMGMFSLTRPIVATIFGSVTTYIVIILQFQSLDKANF